MWSAATSLAVVLQEQIQQIRNRYRDYDWQVKRSMTWIATDPFPVFFFFHIEVYVTFVLILLKSVLLTYVVVFKKRCFASTPPISDSSVLYQIYHRCANTVGQKAQSLQQTLLSNT